MGRITKKPKKQILGVISTKDMKFENKFHIEQKLKGSRVHESKKHKVERKAKHKRDYKREYGY